MTRLYFDTETTGKIQKYNKRPENMPHIVQLAALLIDDEQGEIAGINLIIKPDGFTIPAEATAVHGISQDMAEKYGIPLVVALGVFSNMLTTADQLIAHNIAYDDEVTQFEIERLKRPNRLKTIEKFCTMQASINHCRIPGKFQDFKWPSLQEAHMHFMGYDFDGAHDALADVKACVRIHQAILQLENQ